MLHETNSTDNIRFMGNTLQKINTNFFLPVYYCFGKLKRLENMTCIQLDGWWFSDACSAPALSYSANGKERGGEALGMG